MTPALSSTPGRFECSPLAGSVDREAKPDLQAGSEGSTMLFFGQKKRLIDYASCAG